MNLLEKLQQIERADALIRRKATGSATSLAARLDVSERYVYKLLKLMKDMGAPVYFCHQRNSYCYKEEVVFSVGFLPKETFAKQIRGGKSSLFLPLHDLCSLSV